MASVAKIDQPSATATAAVNISSPPAVPASLPNPSTSSEPKVQTESSPKEDSEGPRSLLSPNRSEEEQEIVEKWFPLRFHHRSCVAALGCPTELLPMHKFCAGLLMNPRPPKSEDRSEPMTEAEDVSPEIAASPTTPASSTNGDGSKQAANKQAKASAKIADAPNVPKASPKSCYDVNEHEDKEPAACSSGNAHVSFVAHDDNCTSEKPCSFCAQFLTGQYSLKPASPPSPRKKNNAKPAEQPKAAMQAPKSKKAKKKAKKLGARGSSPSRNQAAPKQKVAAPPEPTKPLAKAKKAMKPYPVSPSRCSTPVNVPAAPMQDTKEHAVALSTALDNVPAHKQVDEPMATDLAKSKKENEIMALDSPSKVLESAPKQGLAENKVSITNNANVTAHHKDKKPAKRKKEIRIEPAIPFNLFPPRRNSNGLATSSVLTQKKEEAAHHKGDKEKVADRTEPESEINTLVPLASSSVAPKALPKRVFIEPAVPAIFGKKKGTADHKCDKPKDADITDFGKGDTLRPPPGLSSNAHQPASQQVLDMHEVPLVSNGAENTVHKGKQPMAVGCTQPEYNTNIISHWQEVVPHNFVPELRSTGYRYGSNSGRHLRPYSSQIGNVYHEQSMAQQHQIALQRWEAESRYRRNRFGTDRPPGFNRLSVANISSPAHYPPAPLALMKYSNEQRTGAPVRMNVMIGQERGQITKYYDHRVFPPVVNGQIDDRMAPTAMSGNHSKHAANNAPPPHKQTRGQALFVNGMRVTHGSGFMVFPYDPVILPLLDCWGGHCPKLEAPWLSDRTKVFEYIDGPSRLGAEIDDFMQYMKHTEAEAAARQNVSKVVISIIHKFLICHYISYKFTVTPYGSEALGMSLPNGDIDIVIEPPETWEGGKPEAKIFLMDLEKFIDSFDIAVKCTIREGAVALLEFTERCTGLEVDITFGRSNVQSVAAALYQVTVWKERYAGSEMVPLVTLMKHLLGMRKLGIGKANQPYMGGVSGFVILCLVMGYMDCRLPLYEQQLAANEKKGRRMGKIFIDLLDSLGNKWDLHRSSLVVNNEIHMVPKCSLPKVPYQLPWALDIRPSSNLRVNMSMGAYGSKHICRTLGHLHKELRQACARYDHDKLFPNAPPALDPDSGILGSIIGGVYETWELKRKALVNPAIDWNKYIANPRLYMRIYKRSPSWTSSGSESTQHHNPQLSSPKPTCSPSSSKAV